MKCENCVIRDSALTTLDGTCQLYGKMYLNGYSDRKGIIECQKGIEKKEGRKIRTWWNKETNLIEFEVIESGNKIWEKRKI